MGEKIDNPYHYYHIKLLIVARETFKIFKVEITPTLFDYIGHEIYINPSPNVKRSILQSSFDMKMAQNI